jgi:hypothetical protein
MPALRRATETFANALRKEIETDAGVQDEIAGLRTVYYDGDRDERLIDVMKGDALRIAY